MRKIELSAHDASFSISWEEEKRNEGSAQQARHKKEQRDWNKEEEEKASKIPGMFRNLEEENVAKTHFEWHLMMKKNSSDLACCELLMFYL